VAQVLAYVYQLRAALAGRGSMPQDLPPIVVPVDLDPQTAEAADAVDAAAPADDARATPASAGTRTRTPNDDTSA
jgi:hypothetical protein